MTVRYAESEDVRLVQAFYTRSPGKQIAPDERWVVAEHAGTIVGVVRLCREGGHVILRSMQILDAYQRRGIGARRLCQLEPLIQDQPCYCLPYVHLPAFYARIGFTIIPAQDAPPHQRRRYLRSVADGLCMLVIRRAAGPRP